ncbi:uncharacterized protein LOC132951882 [Metopolophium dirhodum]|uniref:uncharacterized protein LOC132951882 n=1 Tax=Metopolophium dirhodum TaxID=44670 RepID=UPI00298F7827|nr:uncharacterized protein LOC132951882 [Metopolophium dirhodum]
MATTEIDVDAILRKMINKIIEEFTVDKVNETQHFDNESQEHIDEEQVPEDIYDMKDSALDDVVSTLLGEIVEAVCDKVDEGQHFDDDTNQEGVENENNREHIDEKEVLEDINDKEDPDDVVNTLLGEIVEAVCNEDSLEAMAGGDAEAVSVSEQIVETPAEGERDGDGLARIIEFEAPKPADPTPPRGRARRIMATTWKGVRRVTRLMLCGCFRGE